MTWGPHIELTAKKGRQAIGMSYPMIGNDSRMSLRNKTLLYKQVVRPMLTYGAVAWGTAAKSHIHKLQVIQNKFVSISANAPRHTNSRRLQEEVGIPPIKSYIRELCIKQIHRAELHENPLITASLDYTPTIKPRRNRPKAVLLSPDDT